MSDDPSLDELRRRITASRLRISELEGELNEAADQEAETMEQLEHQRTRKAELGEQLHEARQEASSLKLQAAGARPRRGVESVAGVIINSSDATATLVEERDRLADEVAQLTKALAAAQIVPTESLKKVVGQRHEDEPCLTQIDQIHTGARGAARIIPSEGEDAGTAIEAAPDEAEAVERDKFDSSDEEVLADDETGRLTRYERSSAKLPSMGEDASKIVGSLEDLRESLRRH
jgi:chromosome segregation ATPase